MNRILLVFTMFFLLSGVVVAQSGDTDGDGIPDASDNCASLYNATR